MPLVPAPLVQSGPDPCEPVARYLVHLTPASRRVQGSALSIVAKALWGPQETWQTAPWHKLTVNDLMRLRLHLSDCVATTTANRYLTAVRNVLRHARRIGWTTLTDDDLHVCRHFGGDRPVAGRVLPNEEVSALLEACVTDNTELGRRDAFCIAVMYGLGLRVAELCALRRRDLAYAKLCVRGKGRRYRWMHLAPWLRPWFAQRLRELPEAPETKLVGYTESQVRHMLDARAKLAGVKHCTPHDFRRTFITELLRRDVDVITVSRLAGHASITSTAIYDRRDEEDLEDALSRLSLVVPGPDPARKNGAKKA